MMIKVKKKCVARGVDLEAGKEVDVDAATAQTLIDGGFATTISDKKPSRSKKSPHNRAIQSDQINTPEDD